LLLLFGEEKENTLGEEKEDPLGREKNEYALCEGRKRKIKKNLFKNQKYFIQ
jgi:hypothetical protein